MSGFNVYIVSFIQVASDVTCVFASAKLAKSSIHQKSFFLLNCFAFILLTIADIYYNYVFRILKSDILLSAGLINTLPLMFFQLSQSYNWYRLLQQQKVKIFSWFNLPYLLFSATATCILAYFFFTTNRLSVASTAQDVLSIALDMFVWFFTIICLGRVKNNTIAVLALGCLMIISADLTMTCLFMFDMNNVEFTEWPHIVWAIGTFLMAVGFLKSNNQEEFTFFSPNSIHANCSWWLLVSSLIAFIIGFIFPFLFTGIKGSRDILYALWDVPISLMFTMIAATLLSNRFSKVILSPINLFTQSIESFNAGEQSEITVKNDIKEFKILSDFIQKSFTRISKQLEREKNISAQVAHDIRSPLSALEIGIKLLPISFDESRRVLLRDAVRHIKDITNILEKNDSNNKANENTIPSQLAVLLDNVISERRLALSCHDVKINQLYQSEAYGYFSNVVPSMIKRVLTNLFNNSYDAIGNNSGLITVNLHDHNGFCIISITDSGHGIPSSDSALLFNKGFTTKKNGHGLGLYHAKETLAEWGASIEIFSTEKKGTEVKILIPLVAPPLWFVSRLSLMENELVVCIDDSISVLRIWQERFKSFSYNPKLIYCSTKEAFLKELNYLKYKSATYLIDFEFSGKTYQGYDFTNLLMAMGNPKNRIFMVTSHSGESDIQNYCVRHSIHIIPKNFAVKIPLHLFDTKKHLIVLTTLGNKETISLDNSKWHVYSNSNDLISDMPYFNHDSRIYIQNDAHNERVGIELIKHNLTATFFSRISNLTP